MMICRGLSFWRRAFAANAGEAGIRGDWVLELSHHLGETPLS
jgi:hypothetical protein